MQTFKFGSTPCSELSYGPKFSGIAFSKSVEQKFAPRISRFQNFENESDGARRLILKFLRHFATEYSNLFLQSNTTLFFFFEYCYSSQWWPIMSRPTYRGDRFERHLGDFLSGADISNRFLS